MTQFCYIITEGVLDVVLITQVIQRGLGGELVKRMHDLSDNGRTYVKKRFKFPYNDDITRRSVPMPAFLQIGQSLIILGNAQGLSRIKDTIESDQEAFKHLDWYPDAMAVIYDADNQPPMDRFSGFAELFQPYGYPTPTHLEQVVRANGLRAGLFAFPGQGRRGTLEDVLLPLAVNRFPELSQYAVSYVDTWFAADIAKNHPDFKELRNPSGVRKAKLSALASLLKPAKPITASIEDQKWVPITPEESEPLAPLVSFVRQLLEP
jgi:hypothetical protein